MACRSTAVVKGEVFMRVKTRRAGTTVDDLYKMLRERILKGQYFPGLRLSQQALARELNVSRTPVREALSRLQTEGLVIGEANHGMEVAPINDEHAEQSYAIRLLIEPPIVGSLAATLPDQRLRAMEDKLAEMERNSNRIRDFQEIHFQFHTLQLEYYPSLFRDLIESFYAKINRHQRLYFSRPHVPDDFIKLDRALCVALRERKSELARQITEFHLADAALGMALDIDPDYKFSTLLVAARSLGIELDADPDGGIARPAQISWRRRGFESMPGFATNNLIYAATKRRAVRTAGKSPNRKRTAVGVVARRRIA
jgi:DNA-binding GntR family transcriptional regulator